MFVGFAQIVWNPKRMQRILPEDLFFLLGVLVLFSSNKVLV
jgi:hypothetical protein